MVDHVFQAIIEGQKNEKIPSKQTNKNALEQSRIAVPVKVIVEVESLRVGKTQMNLIFSTVSFQVQYVLQSVLIWRDFYFWEFCLNATSLFAWISQQRSKSSLINGKTV